MYHLAATSSTTPSCTTKLLRSTIATYVSFAQLIRSLDIRETHTGSRRLTSLAKQFARCTSQAFYRVLIGVPGLTADLLSQYTSFES